MKILFAQRMECPRRRNTSLSSQGNLRSGLQASRGNPYNLFARMRCTDLGFVLADLVFALADLVFVLADLGFALADLGLGFVCVC